MKFLSDKRRTTPLLLTVFLLIGLEGFAQQVSVQLGPDQIGFNQVFTITITVENDQLKSYSGFPEIPGFAKRGTSSSSSTNIVNGRVSSKQSIIQNYMPKNHALLAQKFAPLLAEGGTPSGFYQRSKAESIPFFYSFTLTLRLGLRLKA